MSDRDELIAKVRKVSAAATPGPWAPTSLDVVVSQAGHRIAEACAGNFIADACFIAESRTLLPALADLAESEGRRADEAEAWIAEAQPLIDMLREYQASQGAPMYQAMMQRMLDTTIVPGSIKLKGQQP